MSTAKLWAEALSRAGIKPKLYEHERLLQAKRNAATELYDALVEAERLLWEKGRKSSIITNALAKARGES